jgi:hypothetical protein
VGLPTGAGCLTGNKFENLTAVTIQIFIQPTKKHGAFYFCKKLNETLMRFLPDKFSRTP